MWQRSSGSLIGVHPTYLRCDHGAGNGLGLIGGADNVESSIDQDRLVGTCFAQQQLLLLGQLKVRLAERRTGRVRPASSGWDDVGHLRRGSSIDTSLMNSNGQTKNEEAED